MTDRQHPLSVQEAAALLNASDAYVRRLLITGRLFGIKVGRVWGIYSQDLASFQRVRRQPGRPRKTANNHRAVAAARRRIESERSSAGTDTARLKPRRR